MNILHWTVLIFKSFNTLYFSPTSNSIEQKCLHMSCYSYFRCGHLYLRYKSTYSITTSALIQIPFSNFNLSTKKKFHRYLHIFSLYCFCFLSPPCPCITLPLCCPLVQNGVSQTTPDQTLETLLPSTAT